MAISFSMPSEGFIKLKAVQQITALSRSTILRRIAENKFPKPIKYGNILLFSVDAIRKFIDSNTYDTEGRPVIGRILLNMPASQELYIYHINQSDISIQQTEGWN